MIFFDQRMIYRCETPQAKERKTAMLISGGGGSFWCWCKLKNVTEYGRIRAYPFVSAAAVLISAK